MGCQTRFAGAGQQTDGTDLFRCIDMDVFTREDGIGYGERQQESHQKNIFPVLSMLFVLVGHGNSAWR